MNHKINANHALLNVAIDLRPEYRLFQIALAKYLKDHFGATVHLYCNGKQDIKYYGEPNKRDVFDTVNDRSILLNGATEPVHDEQAVLKTALEMERKLGCTYNELALCNRHLGRGYILASYHFPRSHVSENTSYIQMLNAYNKMLAFWENEIEDKKITLIIDSSKEAAVMARVYNIPFRLYSRSRYKNYYYWAVNEYLENPEFEKAFRAGAPLIEESITEPVPDYLLIRNNFFKSIGLPNVIKKMLMQLVRYAYWKIRGYQKAKGYYLRDTLKHFLRTWIELRRLKKITRLKLADVKGMKFVYYPLHMEPEAALQGMSPEYFFQLTAIASISRDLPAGTFLVVKEAWESIGLRTGDFYSQIALLKNVIFLETSEFGIDVVHEADAVVTITGSAGFEAAVLGKPVITFGHHNIYNFLPHVYLVKEGASLKDVLNYALSDDFDREKAALDGKRFLGAIVASSNDMRDFVFKRPDSFEMDAIRDAAGALEESLR